MKQTFSTTLAAALALALLVPSTAPRADEMYRWLDPAGRTHFGSTPPPDARQIEPMTPSGSLQVVSPGELERPAMAPQADSTFQPPSSASPARIHRWTRDQWQKEARSYDEAVSAARLNHELFETRVSEPSDTWEEETLDRLRKSVAEAEERRDEFQKRALRDGVPRDWVGLPPDASDYASRAAHLKAQARYFEQREGLDTRHAIALAEGEVSQAEAEVSRSCTKIRSLNEQGRTSYVYPFGPEECEEAREALQEAREKERETRELHRSEQ